MESTGSGFVLFLVLKLSKFLAENKSKTHQDFLLFNTFDIIKKRGIERIYQLEVFDYPTQINTNDPRPKSYSIAHASEFPTHRNQECERH